MLTDLFPPFVDFPCSAWGSFYLLPVISLVVAVYVAQTIHHAFFSPLARIPGPFINRFSNIPFVYQVITGQIHSYSCRLHATYGEVVRIGYNQISLSNTSDTRSVLATHTFPKSPIYEKGLVFSPSMLMTTDPETNKIRRRQLGGAFTIPSIRELEDVIMDKGVESLMRTWDAAISDQGKSANVNYFYMLNSMTFDVIGSLSFGCSFGILETGNTVVIDYVKDMLQLTNVSRMFPIIRRISWLYPKLKRSTAIFIGMVRNAVATRRQLIAETGASPQIDILQKFLDAADPVTGEKLTDSQLYSELVTMLIAGTDTTATTLSWTIMHLLNNPHVYRRATKEVRAQFPDTSKSIRFSEARSNLPYLSAVLHESMRLSPVSGGYFPRSIPPGGATIQGHFIPHGTHIAISYTSSHRNPSVWKNPQTFDPERFLGDDGNERVKDVLTFSSGVRICVGKNLALAEMYTTLANILRRYDLSLPKDSPYGPHRTDEHGAPLVIPGKSFFVFGPVSPELNCQINISLA